MFIYRKQYKGWEGTREACYYHSHRTELQSALRKFDSDNVCGTRDGVGDEGMMLF